MALFLKDIPVGIDVAIHKAQKKLHDALDLSWSGLECYPRCYVIEAEQGCTIAHFVGHNDYEPVIHSDKSKCFFVVKPQVKHVGGDIFIAEVELFFIVDLAKAKSTIDHRADEEVRVEVLNVLNMIPSVYVIDIITKQEVVFKDYVYNDIDDMQPHHCFKITLKFEYDINEQICLTN